MFPVLAMTMDSRSILPLVAGVVVLSILCRWLPLSAAEAQRDPLGRGMPLVHLSDDTQLLKAGREVEHLDRAMLRPPSGKGAQRSQKLWLNWFKQVDEIRAAQAAGEQPRVQFKGLLRNDQFLLSYDLYPTPVTGVWAEEGGRSDEPTGPGVTHVLSFESGR